MLLTKLRNESVHCTLRAEALHGVRLEAIDAGSSAESRCLVQSMKALNMFFFKFSVTVGGMRHPFVRSLCESEIVVGWIFRRCFGVRLVSVVQCWTRRGGMYGKLAHNTHVFSCHSEGMLAMFFYVTEDRCYLSRNGHVLPGIMTLVGPKVTR